MRLISAGPMIRLFTPMMRLASARTRRPLMEASVWARVRWPCCENSRL